MKRLIICLIGLIFIFMMAGCGKNSVPDTATENGEDTTSAEETVPEESQEQSDSEDSRMKQLVLTINDQPVSVKWEDNESVAALRELAEQDPIVVDASAYGGFEQVGSLGTTLPSNDTNIKTSAGDIMLYTSSNIVIFYGNNSWAYTRLGKITDKSKSELQDMLSGNNAVFRISVE